jgi:hypothetical protein
MYVAMVPVYVAVVEVMVAGPHAMTVPATGLGGSRSKGDQSQRSGRQGNCQRLERHRNLLGLSGVSEPGT